MGGTFFATYQTHQQLSSFKSQATATMCLGGRMEETPQTGKGNQQQVDNLIYGTRAEI